MQLSIPKIVTAGLIDCTQEHLRSYLNTQMKIRESLEINNLEAKVEYDKFIKALNRDRGNIVNVNLWKPLFSKINMARHDNVVK